MLKKIQHELGEMQITVRELSVLEDYDGVDYSEILTDTQWLHRMLTNRLITLRNRK